MIIKQIFISNDTNFGSVTWCCMFRGGWVLVKKNYSYY